MSGPVIPVSVPAGGGPVTITLLVTVDPAPPVLTSVVLTPSGPVSVVGGQTRVVGVAGFDQYNQPMPVSVAAAGNSFVGASVNGQDVVLLGLQPGTSSVTVTVS